jgi:hypothetical protein
VVGAELVALWQTRTPLLVDAAVLAGCALALGGPKFRRPPAPANAARAAAWTGLRLLREDRPLRTILVPVATVIVAVDLRVVVDVFFATRVLATGPVGYGALVTAWGGGMIPGRWRPAD